MQYMTVIFLTLLYTTKLRQDLQWQLRQHEEDEEGWSETFGTDPTATSKRPLLTDGDLLC
jgi:hypothetical protein